MNIIIQKFGGSSLATSEDRQKACQQVIKAVETGYQPVVVVSAMGRAGAAYATDTLLDLPGDRNNLSARQQDLLASCGEVISSVIIAGMLTELDYSAQSLTGGQAGIITDDNFGASRIIAVKPERVVKLLEKNIIPVVAGYQGLSQEGEITTLGRGGSDTTASALGYTLDADKIEIFSDVDGLMTADPSIYARAKNLEEVTFTEACELAYQGAEVIHPRATEFAQAGNIPLRIRAANNLDDNNGTVIKDSRDLNKDRPVTGLAVRRQVSFIEILPDFKNDYKTGLRSFRLLADNGISVDMINIRPEKISFIVDNPVLTKAEKLLDSSSFSFDISDKFCKVSIVGSGMTGLPGVMARIVDALNTAGIKIYQTTDSHTSIACLIEKRSEEAAIAALHQAFKLNHKE
ncbi:MAG: aspartate kinase [Bacillota bacterium]